MSPSATMRRLAPHWLEGCALRGKLTVVQAGDIAGGLTVNSPTTVNQTAVARDGGTVHQAGRDVRRD